MSALETINIGKTVAVRVGRNIREVRTRLSMTQFQLAAPEFSVSYISAIERGKIRPSLKALSTLAKRLDVPLTFLLEGSPSDTAEARAVGYSSADSGPDQRIELDLLHAGVLIRQSNFRQAVHLLAPIHPGRITTDQVYRLYLLRGEAHIGAHEYQEAVVDLRSAVTQGQGLNDSEYIERARNLLGKAYFLLYNYTLALDHHIQCHAIVEQGAIVDPIFKLDVLSNLANDYLRVGDTEKSVAFFRCALELFDGTNHDSKSLAQQYMESSQHYRSIGKLEIARDYATHSLAIYEMRDEQKLVGLTHQRLGKALEKQNNLDAAEQEYRCSIAIERELNDDIALSICHTSLAELLLKCGKMDEANKEAEEALTCARSSNDLQTQGQALAALAEIRDYSGDFTAADQFFTDALNLLDRSDAHEITAQVYVRFANLLEERGEVQRSLAAIKKAYKHQSQGKHVESI